jgi:cytidine deaminase
MKRASRKRAGKAPKPSPPRDRRASASSATAKEPEGLGDLTRLARRARRRAIVPFSSYRVGAALRTRSGEIVTGCNIENATYGLTLCAERVAVFKAVSEGLRRFEAIAVAVDSPLLAAPCGACRQILWEFCGDIWVHLSDLEGHSKTLRLSELLPLPFDARNL